MTTAYRTLLLCALLTACTSSRIEKEVPAEIEDFKAEAQVREIWSAEIGSLAGKYDARLVPVVDEKKIYVTNAQGVVRALATDTGKQLWETNLDMAVSGGIAAGEGLVVVGTRKGEVIALNAADGSRRWPAVDAKPEDKIKVSSEVQAAAAVRKGMVVVQSVDGRVTALSAADGKRLWIFDRSEPALSLRGTSTPVIVADFVLTGFANGTVVALHIKDGRLLWEQAVAPPRGRNEIERMVDVDAAPLVWGDMFFAVAYQGKVMAVDLRSGRVAWTRDLSSYVGMDADRKAVFVTDEKSMVVALDQQGGASLWKQDKLRGRSVTAPVLQENNVVVADFEGYIHWLAREDGHLVARYRLDGAVQARGLVEDRTLYVASRSGHLAALQLVPNQ